jgi:hypothetical protein
MVAWTPGIKAGPEDILVRLTRAPGKDWDGGDLLLSIVDEEGKGKSMGKLVRIGYKGVLRFSNLSRKLGVALEPPNYTLYDITESQG